MGASRTWALSALLLLGCGGSESRAAPTVVASETTDALAEAPPASAESPSAPTEEPECVVGEVRTLAQATGAERWSIASGGGGYALAYCDADSNLAFQSFDRDLAPRGEPRVHTLACSLEAPLIAPVAERWVVKAYGPCTARARRASCTRTVVLDAAGALVGGPLRARGSGHPQTVVSGSDRLYMSSSLWDRSTGETPSADFQIRVADDGALSVDYGHFDGAQDCWRGTCLAGEGDRVIAILTDARYGDGQRYPMHLWRSWNDEPLLVRSLPTIGDFEGSFLSLCDGAAWLGLQQARGETRMFVHHVARVDLESGEAELWLEQLDPAPALPSCADPSVVVSSGQAAVQWRDIRGVPVGDAVPVGLPSASVVGDASSALVAHRQDDGSLRARRVVCRAPRSGAQEPSSPPGAVAARMALDGWASALQASGEGAIAYTRSVQAADFSPPHRLRRPQSEALPARVAPPVLGADRGRRTFLDSASRLEVAHRSPHSRRPWELVVEGARTMAFDATHIYLGTDTEVVQLHPSAGPLRVRATVPTEGLAVVDLAIADHTLYAALAGPSRGAVVAIDLEGELRETGRVALPAPAVAIDRSRLGLFVATATHLHRVEREGAALSLGAEVATRPVHDLAVSRTGVFTVGPGGQVSQHRIGDAGVDRELAPQQPVRGTEQRWLLRAVGNRLWRAGEDLAVIVVPSADAE